MTFHSRKEGKIITHNISASLNTVTNNYMEQSPSREANIPSPTQENGYCYQGNSTMDVAM
jgi:hypothetical protein